MTRLQDLYDIAGQSPWLDNLRRDWLQDGRLADIAPTLLALMDLPQPAEMTGRSLLRGHAARAAE